MTQARRETPAALSPASWALRSLHVSHRSREGVCPLPNTEDDSTINPFRKQHECCLKKGWVAALRFHTHDSAIAGLETDNGAQGACFIEGGTKN